MSEQQPSETRYGIQELADLGGVTRRTVRYYVRLGLLPPPLGTGRGKHYSQEHVDALVQVRELQEQGVSLTEIGEQMEAGEDPPPGGAAEEVVAIEQVAWTRVTLRDGVELSVKGRGVDSEKLRRLQEAVLAILDG